MSSELWLLAGVLAVLGLGLWKGLRPVLSALDARAEGVRSELARAQSLREEAERHLAAAEARHASALAESGEIVRGAEVAAARLEEEARAELASFLERGRAQAEFRLAQAEAELRASLRAEIVELGLAAAESVLREGLSDADRARHLSEALAEAESRLRG